VDVPVQMECTAAAAVVAGAGCVAPGIDRDPGGGEVVVKPPDIQSKRRTMGDMYSGRYEVVGTPS